MLIVEGIGTLKYVLDKIIKFSKDEGFKFKFEINMISLHKWLKSTMINTLSDVSRAHLKQFYHSIQIQDEVFFCGEILQ